MRGAVGRGGITTGRVFLKSWIEGRSISQWKKAKGEGGRGGAGALGALGALRTHEEKGEINGEENMDEKDEKLARARRLR